MVPKRITPSYNPELSVNRGQRPSVGQPKAGLESLPNLPCSVSRARSRNPACPVNMSSHSAPMSVLVFWNGIPLPSGNSNPARVTVGIASRATGGETYLNRSAQTKSCFCPPILCDPSGIPRKPLTTSIHPNHCAADHPVGPPPSVLKVLDALQQPCLHMQETWLTLEGEQKFKC